MNEIKQKKILCVIYGMGAGGAERVMAELCNYMAQNGHEITLATLSICDDFYEISPQVKRISVDLRMNPQNIWQKLSINFKRIQLIRQLVKNTNPDGIISFIDLTNIMMLISTMGMGVPIIISEHINPKFHKLPLIWEILRKISYNQANYLTILTKDVQDWACKIMDNHKIIVINNAIRNINDSEIFEKPILMPQGNIILAAGRFTAQKGFDLLIKSFAQSQLCHQNWHLVILGEGELKNQYISLINEYGLQQSVHLLGVHKNLKQWFQHADIFVLSSRFEGFGLVLVEAMQNSMAVISFACPSGPSEIIENDEMGILIPPQNIALMAQAMVKLANNPQLRQSMGEKAKISVINRYNPDLIYKKWLDLCAKIIHK